MNSRTNLKPCPNCGSAAKLRAPGAYVDCDGCGLIGPRNDPTGSKWNALPRRGGATPGQVVDEPTEFQRASDVWRAALTLANNLCVQRSDRWNAGDGPCDRISEASDCAKRIREFIAPSPEALAGMLVEAGALVIHDGSWTSSKPPAQPTGDSGELPPCAVCGEPECYHCMCGDSDCFVTMCGDHAYLDPRTVPPRPATGPDGQAWSESKWKLLPPKVPSKGDNYYDVSSQRWGVAPFSFNITAGDSFGWLRWRARLRAEQAPRCTCGGGYDPGCLAHVPPPVTVEHAVTHSAASLRSAIDALIEMHATAEGPAGDTLRRFLAQQGGK